MMLEICPMTLKEANSYVEQYHRPPWTLCRWYGVRSVSGQEAILCATGV